MLIKCPECNLQVSNHAIACPHCGYPLQTTAAKKQRTKQRRRKKLPNGFGQISEIKTGNLYKPFRAMVTVGKDFYGRPIRKLLKPVAFFKTYNEAYAALVEYNKNPYDLDDDLTVEELYEKWTEEYFKTYPIHLAKEQSNQLGTTALQFTKCVPKIYVRDTLKAVWKKVHTKSMEKKNILLLPQKLRSSLCST